MRPRGGAGARDMPPAHQIDASQTTVVRAGAVAVRDLHARPRWRRGLARFMGLARFLL